MKRRVIITGPAQKDILSNHAWWAKNRSAEQADRWLASIYESMLRLDDTADRHSLATEIALRKTGIRQLNFGLGKSLTHRVIYGVEGNRVIIFRVRAFKQDEINLDDLD